jgi:hypothetical protein
MLSVWHLAISNLKFEEFLDISYSGRRVMLSGGCWSGCWNVITTGAVTSDHVKYRVCVSGNRVGILRQICETEPTSGVFCGMQLNELVWRQESSMQRSRYFDCRQQNGTSHRWHCAPSIWVHLAAASMRLCQQEERDTHPERVGPLQSRSQPPSIREKRLARCKTSQTQPSVMPTSTSSSVASNAVPWESWSHCSSFLPTSSTPWHFNHHCQSSKKIKNLNFLELGDSLNILTCDQISLVGS